ncbi:MAG: hypothetical protein IIY22_03010, partial [Erysipelotrichaceae bacterium]|nr:hypothetical protein [Erysipelotrichaceae bacterium]
MIYTSDAFPLSIIRQAGDQTRPQGNQKTKKKRTYKNLVCAFDIETTRIPEIEDSFMYIWQMQVESITVIGRTWDEFLRMMRRIADDLADDTYIVIWVHNLSY